jgi:hypothetical protein
MKDLYSIVIATTNPALENFTPAFKDRIGKTMVLPTIVRGNVLNIEWEILNPKHQIINNIKIQNPKRKVGFAF